MNGLTDHRAAVEALRDAYRDMLDFIDDDVAGRRPSDGAVIAGYANIKALAAPLSADDRDDAYHQALALGGDRG